MKNWKRVANYSLVDNDSLQLWVNRIGHYFMTWIAFPVLMLSALVWTGAWFGGMSRNAMIGSMFGEILLIGMSAIGYAYYVPKGFRRYFQIVCLTPMGIGFVFFVVGLVKVLYTFVL